MSRARCVLLQRMGASNANKQQLLPAVLQAVAPAVSHTGNRVNPAPSANKQSSKMQHPALLC